MIATNPPHARHLLSRVISRVNPHAPGVRSHFLQGNREEMFQWVEGGDADPAIGTECDASLSSAIQLFYDSCRPIIAATCPLIASGFNSNQPWKLRQVFEERGLIPKIVVSATDADVGKAYVGLGIGSASLPHLAYDRSRDGTVRAGVADGFSAPRYPCPMESRSPRVPVRM